MIFQNRSNLSQGHGYIARGLFRIDRQRSRDPEFFCMLEKTEVDRFLRFIGLIFVSEIH